MSECVVRMEMPSKDKVCGMVFDFDGIWYCPAEKKICRQPDNGEMPSWCPILCQLPEGHGRLVDADAILNDKGNYFTLGGGGDRYYHETILEYSQTIVPAERSET